MKLVAVLTTIVLVVFAWDWIQTSSNGGGDTPPSREVGVGADSESKQVVREVDVNGTRFKIDAHATMLHIKDDEVLALLVGLIRLHGHRCDTMNAAYPSPFGGGVTVICHDYAYKYSVEDRGGRWSVTLD